MYATKLALALVAASAAVHAQTTGSAAPALPSSVDPCILTCLTQAAAANNCQM